MGYSQNLKAYRCYYPKTGPILVSRNVFFIESKDNHPCLFRPGVEIRSEGGPATDDPFQKTRIEGEHWKADAHEKEVAENRDNNDLHAEALVIAPFPEDQQPDVP